MVSWNIWSFGTHSQSLISLAQKTYTGGNLKAPVYSLLDQLIEPFSPVPSTLSLGNGCGKLGHLTSAKFLFGLQSVTAVGQLPHPDHCPLCDQEDETDQHILTLVFSPDNFG
jgi:hypothetical protein